jgi:murein DD-endopeptidase MepM/ murein hydrolase activator NlpD
MQLMWLSSPTAKVRSVSITTRHVVYGFCAIAFFLILLGILFHFIGLRVAIEMKPELAQSVAGVTSKAEHDRMEGLYREKLQHLQAKLDVALEEVKELEGTKERFMQMVVPEIVKQNVPQKPRIDFEGLRGQGGPFKPWVRFTWPQAPTNALLRDMEATQGDIEQVSSSLDLIGKQWRKEQLWLEGLPISLPISGDFRVSSVYGLRQDPLTGRLAMHEGLDFVADIGHPVVASASGEVIRSTTDPSYGHMVDVQHKEGFVTRYAHLSQRQVIVGQQVRKGQTIGLLGNTGRSTGPHLHYEVFHKGNLVNPAKLLKHQLG